MNINSGSENNNEPPKAPRGFAAMPEEKVEEIASKGGQASARKAGHEGMAERGSKGGHASAQKAGHEGMAERGSKGGQVSAERAGHEGMAERGRLGGQASGASRRGNTAHRQPPEEEAQAETESWQEEEED